MRKYDLPLPTTGALFFSSSFRETRHGDTTLNAASNYRAQLRNSLKTIKRSEDKDLLTLLKTIEDYLPALFAVANVTGFENDQRQELHAEPAQPDFILEKPFVTSWRAVFMDHKVPGKAFPRVDYTDIKYELAYVCLTYACALSNFASSHLSLTSTTTTTTSLTPSSSSPQRAIEALCKAAGILDYISTTILRSGPPPAPPYTGKLTPEMYPELSAALSRLVLGTAQMTSVHQLEVKGASNAILCRVAVAASDHFSAAIGILGSHPMAKVVPQDLKDHLSLQYKSAQALAYLYLGMERAKMDDIGFAIGCAEQAEALHKSERVSGALREWTRENNQVAFQQLVSRAQVQTKLPSGRDFVKLTPFEPMTNDQSGADKQESYAGVGGYY